MRIKVVCKCKVPKPKRAQKEKNQPHPVSVFTNKTQGYAMIGYSLSRGSQPKSLSESWWQTCVVANHSMGKQGAFLCAPGSTLWCTGKSGCLAVLPVLQYIHYKWVSKRLTTHDHVWMFMPTEENNQIWKELLSKDYLFNANDQSGVLSSTHKHDIT